MTGAFAVVTRDNFVTWEMKALYRAARERGFALVRIDPARWSFDLYELRFEEFSGSFSRRAPEIAAALGRVDEDAVAEGARALEVLAHAGIPVINGPTATRTGRDKALSALALLRHGVPQPRTRIMGAGPLEAFRRLEYPVVVKPLVGGQGRRVAKAGGPGELVRLLGEGAPVLVQEHVANVERELRIVVLDGEIVASVCKVPAPGEWRANLSLGASAMPAKPGREAAQAALGAAVAVGADFAAVDVLETPDGPLVIDVNVCPGFRHVEAVTGARIAGRLIDALRARAAGAQCRRTQSAGARDASAPGATAPLTGAQT